MDLHFIDWEIDGVTVLTLSGRLVLGEPTKQFRATIRELIAQGKANILLNLRDVQYMDSSGLGDLTMAYTSCKKAGGALKLTNLASRAQNLLQLTKLYMVFEIFTDEQEAIRVSPRRLTTR